MTLEKPWLPEVEALHEALVRDWGGEIREAGRSAAADFWLYPVYETRRDGLPVHVEVSEFPGGKPGRVEAGDNVEYLRVRVGVPTSCDLRVSHEGLLDKVHKLLGLTDDHRTGDARFDRRYLLRVSSPEDEGLLADERFRATVETLEPFALLSVTPEGVLTSRLITAAATLAPEPVREMVGQVLRVASLASP
jgi:hypothetical protein